MQREYAHQKVVCCVTGGEHKEGDSQLGGAEGILAEHWELNLRVVELCDVDTLAVSGLHDRGLDDVQLMAAYTVSGGHFRVHLLDCTVQSEVTVLLVHVMVTST